MNDPAPPSLREAIDRLPRAIPPARDLWPDIRKRISRPARRRQRAAWMSLAAAAAVAFAWIAWPRQPSGPAWSVATVSGAPRIGDRAVAGHGRWRIGQWLVTDQASSARIEVGSIGEVRVEANSRLRLVSASHDDHRLELAHGRLSALIWAPPRLFFVETPAATAIDLGCAYTLSVDDRGIGLLEVTAGYVALENRGRESIVPAGMACLTQPGSGPGTPFSVRASPQFRTALNRLDAGDPAALGDLIAAAGFADAVSLWHVLVRVPPADRGAVFDKLASLRPPPEGITRAGILAGDAAMHDRWAPSLGLWPVGSGKKKSPPAQPATGRPASKG